MGKIIAEAKGGKQEPEKEGGGGSGGGTFSGGSGGVNGNGGSGSKTDVRIPEVLVKEGVRIVRGALEEVLEFES